MKEKIENLIQHHKEACQELEMLLNELHGLENKTEEKDLVERTIDKYSSELAWRKLFLQDLNDLL